MSQWNPEFDRLFKAFPKLEIYYNGEGVWLEGGANEKEIIERLFTTWDAVISQIVQPLAELHDLYVNGKLSFVDKDRSAIPDSGTEL